MTAMLMLLCFVYPPVREFYIVQLGKVLSDIESHMPAGHIYRDNDKVTWAHETTHGVHSNIRSKYKSDGYYLLGNAAILFKSPKVTLSQISKLTRYKGGVYRLYLIDQQRYWNNDPLYVLDEWVAYSNSAWAGIELNLNRGDSLEYALEFCFYAEALKLAIEKYDVGYSDKKRVYEFIYWNTQRCFVLTRLSKGTRMEREIHDTLRISFENPDVKMFIGAVPQAPDGTPQTPFGCKYARARMRSRNDAEIKKYLKK